MSEAKTYNRFEEELEEVNRNSSPADLKMLQDFYRMIEQIESIPTLPQAKPNIPEEFTPQQISLESHRRCLRRNK